MRKCCRCLSLSPNLSSIQSLQPPAGFTAVSSSSVAKKDVARDRPFLESPQFALVRRCAQLIDKEGHELYDLVHVECCVALQPLKRVHNESRTDFQSRIHPPRTRKNVSSNFQTGSANRDLVVPLLLNQAHQQGGDTLRRKRMFRVVPESSTISDRSFSRVQFTVTIARTVWNPALQQQDVEHNIAMHANCTSVGGALCVMGAHFIAPPPPIWRILQHGEESLSEVVSSSNGGYQDVLSSMDERQHRELLEGYHQYQGPRMNQQLFAESLCRSNTLEHEKLYPHRQANRHFFNPERNRRLSMVDRFDHVPVHTIAPRLYSAVVSFLGSRGVNDGVAQYCHERAVQMQMEVVEEWRTLCLAALRSKGGGEEVISK